MANGGVGYNQNVVVVGVKTAAQSLCIAAILDLPQTGTRRGVPEPAGSI